MQNEAGKVGAGAPTLGKTVVIENNAEGVASIWMMDW